MFCLAERGLYLSPDYALCKSQRLCSAGVRARALSGSTPDYPDDEHETLCGCLCVCVRVCVVLFLYGHPERAVLMNF